MALSEDRKADRRRNLIAVAQTLIREGGDAGFSMGLLASRAGVSPATPYNLLGPKPEVLRLVVAQEFEGFAAKLAGDPEATPLAALLDATALVVEHYDADRAFYRGLFHATLGQGPSETRDLMMREGRMLWRGMVEAAVVSGELAPTTRVEPLTDHLLRTISIITLTWLTEDWPADRFALEMAYAITLPVAALASDATRPMLTERLAKLQRVLAEAAPAND